MNILVVFCHPRRNSFTGAIADAFVDGARSSGHEVEFADLYAEGFDPRLEPDDEPDWADPSKRYTDEVHAEMQRIEASDAVVLLFPVWWWSMPAMLKGWIDRVWNLGWAYGPRKLPHTHALALGVAAASSADFAKRGYDEAFRTQIGTGILQYCGIEGARTEILHGSTDGDDERKRLLIRAREFGEAFPARL